MTETLEELVERHLVETGRWQLVRAPHLRWVDLRRKEVTGDGAAVDVGDAVQRELRYEAEER